MEKNHEGGEPEEPIEEVADLEELAKAGKEPPNARTYLFKVNDKSLSWSERFITGRQVLEAAGLTPPDNYSLRMKRAGGTPERVELGTRIDLRMPGIEKFRAIRKEQQEGEDQGRRNAPVLDQDRLFLEGYGLRWEIIQDGSTWVMLHGFPLPDGYSEVQVIVAIRIETGYPITGLDMMYLFPGVRRLDGKPIVNSDVIQEIDGKPFQRWSRHRTGGNPWVPGEDSLETHVYLVEEYFRTELTK